MLFFSKLGYKRLPLFIRTIIAWLVLIASTQPLLSQQKSDASTIYFDFCGTPLHFTITQSPPSNVPCEPTDQDITTFYETVSDGRYQSLVAALLTYKKEHQPADWLFYQLIRKTAQLISPKAEDYNRYTLYKWFLLLQTGYDAMLTLSGDRILFYVRSDEEVYNIPTRMKGDQQYVCLNYHDYGAIDFSKIQFTPLLVSAAGPQHSFSYKITNLPEFPAQYYQEKDLSFNYYNSDYHFKVKLNPQIMALFNNYPAVGYESQLNIPLSKETYGSLIPLLKKNVKGMSTKNGVDYLMRFTRYAFLFEVDSRVFGDEKRMSPEQTLLYEQSDCEDRVALFFYLVKEIYNLPMIVLAYPKHVTIAVQFDKPRGKTIEYNGNKYSVCEPTPQKEDLPIGKTIAGLRKTPYEVVYHYTPR